ncbi:MAG: helix-turn-helix transcriptional regulator [Polynucleobacter sp.]|nr:helix-turn-helix transcriptional regulator [Polynucleobacter sp.]MDZ4057264.1 helix-turn-helix transcriptional regulator [Polynucleobacter sp.]
MALKIEKSTSNIYADIGFTNDQEMMVKAGLAEKIGEIIKNRRLTQMEAALILGMSQPKLSSMLRGQFHGISETKMLQCLNKLGRDIQIVVRKANRDQRIGRTSVVFA